MTVKLFTTPAGEELAVMPRDEYENLLDSAAHDRAMADYRAGRSETLSGEETAALISAPTPLAFWRNKRGMTQGALGDVVGVSQPYIADLERGRRQGDPALFLRLSRALGVAMEDLIEDGERKIER